MKLNLKPKIGENNKDLNQGVLHLWWSYLEQVMSYYVDKLKIDTHRQTDRDSKKQQ